MGKYAKQARRMCASVMTFHSSPRCKAASLKHYNVFTLAKSIGILRRNDNEGKGMQISYAKGQKHTTKTYYLLC